MFKLFVGISMCLYVFGCAEELVTISLISSNETVANGSCEMDDDLKRKARGFDCKVEMTDVRVNDPQCLWATVPLNQCVFGADPNTGKEENATCTYQCIAVNITTADRSYRCLGGVAKDIEAAAHQECKVVYQTNEYKSAYVAPAESFLVMLYTCIQPIIVFGGLLGNALSLILMTSKSMREYSFSCYLAALAITDSFSLLHFGMDWIDEVMRSDARAPFDFRYVSLTSCRLYPYIVQVFMLMSSWLLTIFSIDRCISVCYPFYTCRIFTIIGSKIIILVLFIVTILIQLYHPILEERPNCFGIFHANVPLHSTLIGITRVFLLLLVPFLCVLLTNSKIIWAVRSRVTPSLTVALRDSTRQAERRMTIKLISVSVSFMILITADTFRASLQAVFDRLENNEIVDGIENYAIVTRLIYSVNFGINFLLYGITFKEKLNEFFRCSLSKQGPQIIQANKEIITVQNID